MQLVAVCKSISHELQVRLAKVPIDYERLLDDLPKNSATNFENIEELFSSNRDGESYSITLPITMKLMH